jgi:type IV pilus assembly protein PilW
MAFVTRGTTMKNSENGFTLIELLVAIGMASIIVGVIYSAHRTQTKIYTEQDKVAEMQQNIRSGLMYLQREARMAGYNPNDIKHASCGTSSGAPGIHTATATTFGFSMDLNGDGDCGDSNENVTYSLYTSGGIQKLGRAAPGNQPVAENITHINFVYMFPPPLIGTAVTKSPTSTPAAAEFKNIVAVQVSMLARAKTPDQKTQPTTSFTLPLPNAWGGNAAGVTVWGPFTDGYSRRLLTTTINCRNMGLE